MLRRCVYFGKLFKGKRIFELNKEKKTPVSDLIQGDFLFLLFRFENQIIDD